jgi:hypothetical protein
MPFLARVWSRWPSTWMAETIGGTCRMSPVRVSAAARTSSTAMPRMSQVPVTAPDASRVLVAVPRTTTPV